MIFFVVSESDDRIIWEVQTFSKLLKSLIGKNANPAVKTQGVYEKSIQAFLSAFDPRLRYYYENYEKNDCNKRREMIYKINFDRMMRVALEEAILAIDDGYKGYGAVVVYKDKIVGRAHDSLGRENNPIHHAEIKAIQQSKDNLGKSDLTGAVLFASHEPCPMCASLAVFSNISAIVFGASIAQTSKIGFSEATITNNEIAHKAQDSIEIINGVLEEECLKFYKAIS